MSAQQPDPKSIEVIGLSKAYGKVRVLKDLNLSFERGQIHAFLGANGAGKSTLLGCLSGAVTPSSGTIRIKGTEFSSLTPRTALEQGVGIIYQHFQVFEGLTVAENIFLGREPTRFGRVDHKRQTKVAGELLARLNVSINPSILLDELSVGERKIIEIARALYINPDVLILDEPTAALSDREISALHKVVRQIAHKQQIAVIYVTHLLDEVEEIADVVTVLRDGRVIWTKEKSAISQTMLAEAIAPSANRDHTASHKKTFTGQPVLELIDYSSPFTGPINVALHQGECLGVYGLLGSGRSDLLESLFGARRQMGGMLRLNGKGQHIASPRQALDLGLALVASNRKDQSLFGALSALDNLLMPHFGQKVLPARMRNRRTERAVFNGIAQQLSIKPPNPALEANFFSGGNAQKIVMGRWLLPGNDLSVLLLDEPTQGVDVGAREELYQVLEASIEQGMSVILVSSDPDEIINNCDRVLVLGYGRQIAIIDHPKSEGELVEMAHKSIFALEKNLRQNELTNANGGDRQ